MTAIELHAILGKAIEEGQGKFPIYFDTEAEKYEYHMAKIGAAFVSLEGGDNFSMVSLHEARGMGGIGKERINIADNLYLKYKLYDDPSKESTLSAIIEAINVGKEQGRIEVSQEILDNLE